MRADASRAIYRQLINGKVINKNVIKDGGEVPNELYNEIITNDQDYIELYTNIGYELHPLGEGFLIRELDLGEKSEFRDTAMKVQVLIDVIGRGLQEASIQPELMMLAQAGLSKDHISRFEGNEEFKTILKACGMKQSLEKEIDNVLVARNIASYNHFDRLVFCDVGKAMFDQLMD